MTHFLLLLLLISPLTRETIIYTPLSRLFTPILSSSSKKRMKTVIIFLCLWGFCDASVTNGTTTPITTSPNQTEATDDYNSSSNGTTHSSATAPPDQQTTQATLNCPTPSPTTTTTTTPAFSKLFRVNHLLLIAGGLILACTIFLISTLLLVWKVCQLSRRLKMLSGHSDLMIRTKSWTGNNKSNTDARETAVLMGDVNEARDEVGDGGGEDSEKKGDVCENVVEQMEKAAKNDEMCEGTPAAATEASPEPGEQKSQADKSTTNSTTEDEKEAKGEE